MFMAATDALLQYCTVLYSRDCLLYRNKLMCTRENSLLYTYKQYVYFHTRFRTIYTSIQYPRKASTGLKFEDKGKVANTQPRYHVLLPRCNLYQEDKREITRLVNHGTTDVRPSYLLRCKYFYTLLLCVAHSSPPPLFGKYIHGGRVGEGKGRG